MSLRLRSRAPLSIVVALVLAGSAGAAALALTVGDSTKSGNTQPIDDNHPSPTATPAARPGAGG